MEENLEQCMECEALLENYIRALHVFQTGGVTPESEYSWDAQRNLQHALEPLLRHTSAYRRIQDRA
jgi:hypothetical protein